MDRMIWSFCFLIIVSLCGIDGSAVAPLKRFELFEGACSLLLSNDSCATTYETWYFAESEDGFGCFQFQGAGGQCGGKGNRFQTLEECEENCIGEDGLPKNSDNQGYEVRRWGGGGYPGRPYYHDYCWGHCSSHCSGGYERCHSCSCIEEQPRCYPVSCPDHCDSEWTRDRYGCPSCHCRRRPPCYGYQCGCHGRHCGVCPRVHCPSVCPSPPVYPINPCCCRYGQISRPGCSYRCDNYCQYGHVEHPYQGCRSCECRPFPYRGEYSHYEYGGYGQSSYDSPYGG